ncbi:MAG: DNA-directed RNA polymerase subunit alpha [Candidatus Marinimicrobia bacterium]|jgi:DNA-directed RNA polymerase subunit alpha|nr:DNA-directed RNA polymerase subunit alpha [Candidatus Neomarinimicrobiota bacterium]MDP6456034.1 DNA-directed RNA polymerase subunit alpha [Candidatus Neomarinimicrobiota bacterium]MDP6592633.1 DNA-directed RNA polymerase subunit alpha [Candidatus Neomarinimicrobiota bacterium]MDP6836479.1 DNA-directed RNA polymerase subunit alpha [Candidatus Neomarinimicrobiota bacterium]MDP6967125.1 DNA-directed RNA polymerase subunit alpha [Candidatus Neomarinimicrobiota bacterium]|tara:strand:- start:3502 stop:4476 length:975 start_codon:yes stop_codon:yes gene_type:complete
MTTNGEFKFRVDDKATTGSYGRFELEPLERGNGITVGNALRRILMTSIPGAAIVNMRVDGILHEFSTIDGVVEDVSDIIQNLKQVRFKLKENKPDKVQLSFTGKGNFAAKDINETSKQFKVMNPSLHIATLNDEANFTMELQIGVGKGYVDADSHRRVDSPIGTIFIDSIFNPVNRVTYDVEPVSSAKDSLERLVIEAHTDGTITPENALNHAANVLIEHLSQFVSEEAEPVLKIVEEIDEDVLRIRELLDNSIDEMELSVRSHNCLEAAGIGRIIDLVSKEESEMLKYKNFGRKSLSELVEKLGEMGLSFGMNVKRYMLETEQ